MLERDGRRFTIRPEKIHMSGDGDGEPGRVRDVVYVGMVTRYVVELDSGGELVVVRQNLETSSQEALEARGRRVRLELAAGAHVRDHLAEGGRRAVTRIRRVHVLVAVFAVGAVRAGGRA